MSAVQRQILWASSFALLLALFFTSAYLWEFPFHQWSELLDHRFMNIPIVLFIPVFSVGTGILFGMVSGVYWKNQLQIVEKSLSQLEAGRFIERKDASANIEINVLFGRIERIGKQMSEQVMLSQRLAAEKAEGVEGRIQEIISQERNRLARELHDSVSQQLFAASMMMSAINETKLPSNDRETKQLKMVEEMIHQSQLEMRALLLHLRPAALKGKTLQQGIEDLLLELSQKVTMNIHWKIEDFSVDKGVEDHLFRILQESVSNTLRHSKANSLEILLIKREDLIIMRIIDDGIGFEGEVAKAGSYGMQNMHERAVEVGGTLKVVSVKNQGTRLEVKVPSIGKGGDAND